MEMIGIVPVPAILEGPDLLVVLAIAALLFGGKKIPELAKGLGEGIRNFKSAMKDEPEKPASKEPELISDGAPEKVVEVEKV
jgi:sec-independent protein translocase protein TatA